MDYYCFENAISPERLSRYLKACNGCTRKAMTLYRYNLRVSQEMFTIVSCFEVTLRNHIDRHMSSQFGPEWLRDSVIGNGIFTMPILKKTHDIIFFAYKKLDKNGHYTHPKLLAEMEFGIWKYMFSPIQYSQSGKNLLQIFPFKPRSSALQQYNQRYIFNELDKINSLRNRIAHHEPICFRTHTSEVDTSYIINIYDKIRNLFAWMGIDSRALLYGLDHVRNVCKKINAL